MIPDPRQTPVLPIPAAGELLGLGRSSAYELAARGGLPGLIVLGHRKVVATATLLRVLGFDPGHNEAPSSTPGAIATTSTSWSRE